MTHREGLLLRLSTNSGVVGLGEASPHPATGPEAIQELNESLTSVGPRLIGADIECLPDIDLPPPLACAIDTAALDLLAKARDVSIATLLSDQSRTNVAVNATIGAEDSDTAADQARVAREEGFGCVKLKVGMASSPKEEARRVSAVRSTLGPDVELRLDANGAWSVEQAIETIKALDEFELALVEQPVAADDLEGLVRVRRAVRPPIAADESITSLADAKRVIDMDTAQVLVVKPMVVGGLRIAKEIIDLAQNSSARIIITTTIDAGVGTAAALHLAAMLPEASLACGLATGSLLADDIVTEPLSVREGQMTLPSRPGLGIEIDEAKLAQYSGTERTLP